MDPRNRYLNAPDFAALATSYPALKQYLIPESDPGRRRRTIDFQDVVSQRKLTEAIMFHDFDIVLRIPENRLCPPVPNRLNYVLWIQDIIHAHHSVFNTALKRAHIGIDIGTGATAIYPFIACKLDPTLEMIATELDEESFQCASKNVCSNNLESRIHVLKATLTDGLLFPLAKDPTAHFDFTMCNPPFYSNAKEVEESLRNKELPPNAVCTGAEIEMIYPNGGEVGFVSRIIEESAFFRTRCSWYSSMLGKMSSVSLIIEQLQKRSISNYAITELVQGQTRRWAVAWSFGDTHLPDSIARITATTSSHPLHTLLPPRTTLVHTFSGSTMHSVTTALSEVLLAMDGVRAVEVGVGAESSKGEEEKEGNKLGNLNRPVAFLVEAQSDTWSRRSRRRKGANSSPNQLSTPLTCACRVINSTTDCPLSDTTLSTAADSGRPVVEFQWIFGKDPGRPLFESFASHVWRKLGLALAS